MVATESCVQKPGTGQVETTIPVRTGSREGRARPLRWPRGRRASLGPLSARPSERSPLRWGRAEPVRAGARAKPGDQRAGGQAEPLQSSPRRFWSLREHPPPRARTHPAPVASNPRSKSWRGKGRAGRERRTKTKRAGVLNASRVRLIIKLIKASI